MTQHLLRAGAMRRMAWRNGGGETTEVAVHPPSAGLDAFDWRVSMAGVVAPGPFSLFAGVDRTLAVLDGAGLVLEGSGAAPVTLHAGGPPHAFPGDRPTTARLPGGAVTDLNVMTRRGRWRHALTRLKVTGTLSLEGRGAHAVVLAERPLTLDGPGGAVAMEAWDALLLHGGAAMEARAPDASLWLVELWPDPA